MSADGRWVYNASGSGLPAAVTLLQPPAFRRCGGWLGGSWVGCHRCCAHGVTTVPMATVPRMFLVIPMGYLCCMGLRGYTFGVCKSETKTLTFHNGEVVVVKGLGCSM